MTTDIDRDETKDEAANESARFVLIFAGVGFGVTVLCALVASTPTTLAVLLISLAGAYGAWRGAAATAALVFALLLAALIGIPLGKALEDTIGGAMGLSGLAKRGASIGIVALVVLVGASFVGSALAKRFMRNRVALRRIDRPLGAFFGGIEGILLSLLVMWGALVIQPIAQGRLDSFDPTAPEQPAGTELSLNLASKVVAFAEEIDSSAAGRVAKSTNPMDEAPVIALAEDFLTVSQDREAMAAFIESDAVQRMQEHPSVRRAMEILQNDAQISGVLERGLDRDGLDSIFRSDAVLRVLDETNVADELKPLADELRAALDEALKLTR